MSPHRYARFYGKLTNLYIKMRGTQTNCMEITQQESRVASRSHRDRRIHKAIAGAILQKCSRNCWQFVVLSEQTMPCPMPPPNSASMSCNTFRGKHDSSSDPDLVMFFLCNLSADTFLCSLAHELIVKSYWADTLPHPPVRYASLSPFDIQM